MMRGLAGHMMAMIICPCMRLWLRRCCHLASDAPILQGMAGHMASALLLPAAAALLFLLVAIVQPPVWYSPQYAVPLLGMLLGNSLNGVTVGVKAFLDTISAERAAVEWALARGASRLEAVRCAAHVELRRILPWHVCSDAGRAGVRCTMQVPKRRCVAQPCGGACRKHGAAGCRTIAASAWRRSRACAAASASMCVDCTQTSGHAAVACAWRQPPRGPLMWEPLSFVLTRTRCCSHSRVTETAIMVLQGKT